MSRTSGVELSRREPEAVFAPSREWRRGTSWSAAASLAVLTLTVACSGYPRAMKLPSPPPGRDAVRSLAVVVETSTQPPKIRRPLRPAGGALLGSLAGMGYGFRISLELATAMDGADSLGLLVWAAATAVTVPACTIGGAIIGATKTMPAKEVNRRLDKIERALKGAPRQLGLKQAVIDAIQRERPGLVSYNEQNPDATLTIRLLGYGLLGLKGKDPQVSVVVHVETVWTAGNEESRTSWLYNGPTDAWTTWSDESFRITEQLGRAREQLATLITEELLLVEEVLPVQKVLPGEVIK